MKWDTSLLLSVGEEFVYFLSRNWDYYAVCLIEWTTEFALNPSKTYYSKLLIYVNAIYSFL